MLFCHWRWTFSPVWMGGNEANMEMGIFNTKQMAIILSAKALICTILHLWQRASILCKKGKKKKKKQGISWHVCMCWIPTGGYMWSKLLKTFLYASAAVHVEEEIDAPVCFMFYLVFFCQGLLSVLQHAHRLPHSPLPLSCSPFRLLLGSRVVFIRPSRFVCLFMAAAPVDPEPQ